MQHSSATCRWEAWGDYTCYSSSPAAAPVQQRAVERFSTLKSEGQACSKDAECASGLSCYDRKCLRVNNLGGGGSQGDGGCARHGCPEGRACATTSDCANGLSCVGSKCTRVNPFTRENIRRAREDHDDGLNDDYEEKREKAVKDFREDVRESTKADKKDMIYIDAGRAREEEEHKVSLWRRVWDSLFD
jgi:hypothetical protein